VTDQATTSRTALIDAITAKAVDAFPDDRGPTDPNAAMRRLAKRDAVIAAATGRDGVGSLADLDARELCLVDELLADILQGRTEIHLNAIGRFIVRPRMGRRTAS
jgi:hypothetical protein